MLPQLVEADSFDWLASYSGDPFQAIVTDPPYGLAFMGKAWDNFGTPLGYQQWTQAWATAALGVVTPGAHLAAFGAPRLHHRQMVGLEDAGWEIRDVAMWLYGSGFPKSLNLAGDKPANPIAASNAAGQCQCDVYEPKGGKAAATHPAEGSNNNCAKCGGYGRGNLTNGYGTALKPAYEPIIIARSPLSGTVQQTFDAHGTGALHIDAARIPLNGEALTFVTAGPRAPGVSLNLSVDPMPNTEYKSHDAGRWPANVALDEDAAALLDAEFETGQRWKRARAVSADESTSDGVTYQLIETTSDNADRINARLDIEGKPTNPSRFFYTSKASRAEREAGLISDEVRRSDGRAKDIEHPRLRTNARRNHHPSVKPLDLMRWLCRLVVPEHGRLLDPFAGSGSTLIAAHQESMTAVGIERDADYAEIARGRIAHHCAQQVMPL